MASPSLVLVRRGLRDRVVRYVATGVAVVLGVALAVGSLVLTDTLRSLLRTVSTTGGADLVVRAPATFATASSRARLPDADVERARAVDGVAAAVGTVVGQAIVVGPDGRPGIGRFGAAVGTVWIDDPVLSPVTLRDGGRPTPGEVVIDAATAAELGVGVGDRVGVVADGPVQDLVVGGVAEGPNGGGLGLGSLTLFHPDDAARLLPGGDGVDSVLVALDADADADAVTADLRAALGAGVEVLDAADATRPPRVGFLPQLVTLFAGLGVVVGGFVVVNTFSMLIAQRVRELGLLRALGSTAAQVRRLVVGEAAVLGVTSSLVGAAAGVGIGWLLLRGAEVVGLQPPEGPLVVRAGRLLFGVGLGVVVTCGAALLPALRAGRVTPVDAMREAPRPPRASGRVRGLIAALLGALATALLWWAAVGTFRSTESGFDVAIAGSAALFGAVIAVGPLVVGPVANALSRPLRRLVGPAGRLASANADRHRRRSAATAAALTAGIALVTLASVISSSAQASIGGLLSDVLRADHVVEPIGNRDVSTELADDLRARPELGDVVPAARVDVSIDDDSDPLTVTDVDGLARMIDLQVPPEQLDAVRAGQLLVSRQEAAQRGWRLGQTVTAVLPEAGPVELRIGAVLEDPVIGPGGAPINLLLATDVAERLGLPLRGDRLVWVRGATGVDAATVAEAIDQVLVAFPGVESNDRQRYIDREVGQIEQVLAVVAGLVGLSVLIAVLGIANTLLLGVVERTREIGLLRAIGTTRRQVRTMIQAEGAVLAAIGALTGIVVGLVLAAAIGRSWRNRGFDAFVVPVPLLVAVVVGAVAVGALAATIPARRAAATNVLDAIGVDFATSSASAPR